MVKQGVDMRRMALGLATTLVGGLLAMPGVANAGAIPTSQTLQTASFGSSSPVLQSGAFFWGTGSCSASVCSSLAIHSNSTGGVTVEGVSSSGASTSIGSVVGSATDVTFDLLESVNSKFNGSGPATINGAQVSIAGKSSGGGASFSDPTGANTITPGSITFPGSATFTSALSLIDYTVNLRLNPNLTSANFSPTAPVPEPASAGLLAIALVGLGLVRRRSARS